MTYIFGIATVILFTRLGYHLEIVQHKENRRAYISKGFLRKAQKNANHNVGFYTFSGYPYVDKQALDNIVFPDCFGMVKEILKISANH